VKPRAYTVGDVVRAIEATARRHPQFSWHGAQHRAELPNGRYAVDHATSTVWLSEHLEPHQAFEAMLDALAELRSGAAPILCSSRSALADVLQLHGDGHRTTG